MALTLVEKAIGGNKKAIKELAKRDSKFIYKLAFLHTKYEGDAKIILKNTILFIHKNIRKIPKHKNYDYYLMKVTIKHIKEYLDEFGMVQNHIEAIYTTGHSTKIDLYESIDILDIYLKSAVILRYFYNMSYEDIGNVLEIKENTVKMYIRKSLKIMQCELKEDFHYEREAR
ncbi:MAG: sigma factor-like helix-turn-helix DNA-binding protein [Terrisporobacter sp.]|uniref:sigma factor-like helix-turn-helix DNA-binding protein n=1 Tax=Terrisporobacter sp. TaxID=1965305 RepID=UPI002FC7E353